MGGEIGGHKSTADLEEESTRETKRMRDKELQIGGEREKEGEREMGSVRKRLRSHLFHLNTTFTWAELIESVKWTLHYPQHSDNQCFYFFPPYSPTCSFHL